MRIYSDILGNIADEHWRKVFSQSDVEYIVLDQWTAQKSRFVALTERGNEYAIALKRNTHLRDGDIMAYDASTHRMLVIKLNLNEVMVINLEALSEMEPEQIIHLSVELGHALGNQHWPAVVKGCKIYVPLTVDRKVMASVMHTHNIPHIDFSFLSGDEVIPYLAPHEVRTLFGGANHSEHNHNHADHEH